jgi:hypothetical protein
MTKQPLKKEITIFVKWTYDDDGTILYDYEEMAEGFAFELGLLENERIDIQLYHTGQPLNDDENN